MQVYRGVPPLLLPGAHHGPGRHHEGGAVRGPGHPPLHHPQHTQGVPLSISLTRAVNEPSRSFTMPKVSQVHIYLFKHPFITVY